MVRGGAAGTLLPGIRIDEETGSPVIDTELLARRLGGPQVDHHEG